jgi:hypothetical protein
MEALRGITDYLLKYAEPTPELTLLDGEKPFDHAVFVPVCGEEALIERALESIATASRSQNARTLITLVVNDTPETPEHYRQSNAALLRQYLPKQDWRGDTVLCVLDRSGLKYGGVGVARKIGGDFLVGAYAKGLIRSQWIHCTDADAVVAKDYFEVSSEPTALWGLGPVRDGALVHPFEHGFEGENGRALSLYDRFLRYYCDGLAYAGSPFAFPTVGSTLGFTAAAYAAVRGFPKRDAGEDFYFLHKVAKIAFVKTAGGKVHLPARASDRVPFGTGQSIRKIRELEASGGQYRVYDPQVFELLGKWLSAMPVLSQGEEWDVATQAFPQELRTTLASMKAPEEHALILANRKTPKDRLRHWNTWFDGFKTLKLIHLLRDAQFPNQDLDTAIECLSRKIQDQNSAQDALRLPVATESDGLDTIGASDLKVLRTDSAAFTIARSDVSASSRGMAFSPQSGLTQI